MSSKVSCINVKGKKMSWVVKRSGEEQAFDVSKVKQAISKANNSVTEGKMQEVDIKYVCDVVEQMCDKVSRPLSVEEVSDTVEKELMQKGFYDVAKAYITYRYERALLRKGNSIDSEVLSLLENKNSYLKEENSNKNSVLQSTVRDYMAGLVSKDLASRYMYPTDIMDAHNAGLIHLSDMDYTIMKIFNCCLINLDDMLQNGTVISGTMIEKPHSFTTACTIATQIIAQVASSQYGGQTISLAHLAPFVEVSRRQITEEVKEELESAGIVYDNEMLKSIVEPRVKKQIRDGVQTIQYQIITLMTTNGQAPFLSVFMYLNECKDPKTKADLALIIEEVLKQRIKGVKNSKGIYITPAFPKLLYVAEEDNIREGTPYWYLTVLAAKCSAKRMVPDYISEKVMLRDKIDSNGNGNCYACMGCRSFLTPYVDENGKPKYYGRFNQGVCTVNLVDAGLSADKNIDKFWQILDERLELACRALKIRHEHLEGTLSDVSPIHWQFGAISRLQPGETIDKLLHNNYSTISLGYAGLWECVYALIGKKLTEPEGRELGLKIMQKLNDKTVEWKTKMNVSYSLYGTPLESATYKFSQCLQKRFGVIDGVTDKNYITNSYHVKVTEPIDAFKKIDIESEFQKLSPGGAISYVEVPNLQNNLKAVLTLVQYAYDKLMYFELNSKSDYCSCCGFDGEIVVEKDNTGKFIWKCPQCGNTDQTKMSVARRTCGYVGTQYWNQGRTQEIAERVVHVS